MQYKHLTIEERETIQLMLWEKQSIRAIAKTLNRSPSSIFREIDRNKPPERRVYTPRLAQERAIINRSKRSKRKLIKNHVLRDYTISHLKLGWTPEQIARKSKEDVGVSTSHEAIYQYIYAQIHRNGYGLLRPNCEDLRPYLARRKKRRVQKGMRTSYRIEKGPLPSIDNRSKEADLRMKIGHYEDNLMVSKSKEQIKRIEYLINSRPRKRLGWKTPYEVFYEKIDVALET